MGWRNFNDRLALYLLVVIPLLWILQAALKWQLPSEVNGALIVTFTLVVQFYFRRRVIEREEPPTPPAPPGP